VRVLRRQLKTAAVSFIILMITTLLPTCIYAISLSTPGFSDPIASSGEGLLFVLDHFRTEADKPNTQGGDVHEIWNYPSGYAFSKSSYVTKASRAFDVLTWSIYSP